ncbi:hypothetical protein [Paraburkholderia sp. BR10872]|uniref:hypothetical protein n=1 Tax=Paraburkholderia sp. BR10872 TaxID=3236989 RepID=UPI0034D25C9F
MTNHQSSDPGSRTNMVGDSGSANLYNRQLHPEEKQKIHDLAGGDAAKEARLTAAACAMTHCYAEYPEGSAAYQLLKQIADFGASDALAGERNLLSQQTGMFGYTTGGPFSDANLDAAKQFNNTYQLTTRGAGAAEAVLGAVGLGGAITSARVTCATGGGCVANAVVAGTSVDALIAGSKQVVSGQPESTYLNQALTSLGMSPAAAGLLETALGIGGAATVGSIANQATAQAALLNTASRDTYTTSAFTPQGVQFTSSMIDTNRVVQSIYNDYVRALGGNTQLAETFTGNAVRSGVDIPKVVQLGTSDELVRLVPVGDSAGVSSFYMSRAQYDSLIGQNASATSVADALGLPASSFANGGFKGFQAFSIQPQPGRIVSVYQSTIAPVNQGQYSASGGLLQYIVPDLGSFTSPKPMLGGVIR